MGDIVISLSITEILVAIGGIFTILGLVYKLGMIAQQVKENTRDIDMIFGKIDAIWQYVRNGGKS